MRLQQFAIFLICAAAEAATYRLGCSEPLDKINRLELKPGDRVLLKSGCVWEGRLATRGSGAEGRPIVIDREGSGPRPRIDANGKFEDAILIRNQQWIEVRNLEATNHGEGVAMRRGVHVWLDDFGPARHVVVAGMYVHDVNGILTNNHRKDSGGIIWRTTGDKARSWFEGLTIERNIVWKVDRSGIAAQSVFYDRRRWAPSLNVVIRDNYVEDIGGDGIVPWASDGALVEHNVARDLNKRANEYNVGIWPWSCDNTTLRLNEASLVRTQKDGQGFDSDYNSRNTVLEWNYSHENEGGFLLICTPSQPDPARMLANTGVTVRYNVSRHDHVRTFHLPGPVENVRVHDNAVYTAPGETVNVVQFSDWKGWAKDVEFRDNLFVAGGTARYGHELSRSQDGNFVIGPGFGPARDVRFVGNTYVGTHTDRPEDAQAKTEYKPKKLEWDGPRFDPSKPEGFDMFMRAHRAWLVKLLETQFGRKVR